MNFKEFNKKYKVKDLFLSVSGGLDSTVLAHACLSLREQLPRLHFVHLNYHLRLPDCLEEEKFLQDWADREQIQFHVKHRQAPKNLKGIQSWARRERLFFYEEILSKFPQSVFMLAHHQKDQVETFLLRLIRGGDWKALGGIRQVESLLKFESRSFNQKIILFRPLLDIPKQSLEYYARSHRLLWKEDLSNQKTDYLRNRVRLKLLPELLKENTQFINNIYQISLKIQKQADEVTHRAGRWFKKYWDEKEGSLSVPAFLKLKEQDQEEVLKLWLEKEGVIPGAFEEWKHNFLKSLRSGPKRRQRIPLKKGKSIETRGSKLFLK